MSASRRRDLRSSRRTPTPPADDLPVLEPLAAEPAAAAAAALTIRCEPVIEAGFDAVLAVEVQPMDKQAMLEALRPALRQAVERGLRHRRVLVRFQGDAVIGSGAKDLVGTALRQAHVLLGVVRRGYGDEVVHEGRLPEVAVTTKRTADGLQVEVGGGIEPQDLPFALRRGLAALARDCRDIAVDFAFADDAGRDPAVQELLRAELAAARRLTVGGEVVFDRDLERCVRGQVGEGIVDIQFADDADERQLLAALPLALRDVDCADRQVVVRAAAARVTPAVVELLIARCVPTGPRRIVRDRGADDADQLWPRLLETAAGGGGMLLRVLAGDRSHDAVLAGFAREVQGLGDRLADAAVTVDWPAGFELDADAERLCIHQALAARHPARVACTFGGAQRETFLPEPLRRLPGAAAAFQLDLDAGKPPELARTIDRRIGQLAAELRGKPVRVALRGAGAASRTLQRAIRDACAAAQVARLEIDDQGKVDVVLPPLLTIAHGDAGMQIDGHAGGRDPAQIALALQRELEAAELTPASAVVVAPGPLAEQLCAAAIARGAGRVILGGKDPVQLHPTLFGPPEVATGSLRLCAQPGDDAATVTVQLARELPRLLAAVAELTQRTVTLVWPGARSTESGPLAAAIAELRAANPQQLLLDDGSGRTIQLHPEIVHQHVEVLGRKDGASPPMLLLGIDQGDGSDHAEIVLGKLAALHDQLQGRRVLLVLRHDHRDIAARKDNELLTAVRGVVDPLAAATLVYRGVDPRRRPFFEVAYSTLAGLAVGTRMADPRTA